MNLVRRMLVLDQSTGEPIIWREKDACQWKIRGWRKRIARRDVY